MKRVLVAGIGNMFLGDDAFGCEVVRYLAQNPLPEGVTLVDFGIRGYDLAYAIMDGYDKVIMIDAVQRGEAPGTLFVIEPDPTSPGEQTGVRHSTDPVSVLQMVQAFGETPANVLLVGCEPASFMNDDRDVALSKPVEDAVPRAADMTRSLIDQIMTGNPIREELL